MTPIKPFDHSVQLYRTDQDLLKSITKYFLEGFQAEEPCIIIATPQHRQMLKDQLIASGIDMRQMQNSEKFFELDAANTLSHFMENGMPNQDSFDQVIGSLVPYIVKRPIRAYGEMVALLWEQGNEKAALRLEEMWNNLGKIRKFSLFCAYPLGIFGEDSMEATQAIHQTHSVVVV